LCCIPILYGHKVFHKEVEEIEHNSPKVVILGVWRQLDILNRLSERTGRMNGHVHYGLYELDILNIFFEYSLKYPEYIRIYSNISLSGGHEVYRTSWTDRRSE
jgi:hypothetical protein